MAVTMTTGKINSFYKLFLVGFGDYFPRSHIGRFIMVGSTFVGLFLVSMTIVSLQILKKFENSDFMVN